MSFFSKLSAALKNHLTNLVYVTCYDCGARFYGPTEFEAALHLSKHAILTHDDAPAEDH